MKYQIVCFDCGNTVNGFGDWYRNGQCCPKCGSLYADIRYSAAKNDFLSALDDNSPAGKGIWRYFDFLPLHTLTNSVTAGEGCVAVERWRFLEDIAGKAGLDMEVYAHRHDNNPATGTFKDLAGAAIGSVLKETGIRSYVVATTGNIGVALSRYLADAGVSLHVFVPETSSSLHDAEISCFGQKVFRVRGDYSAAKKMAAAFAEKYEIPLSPNSYDPIRIEAKKTIAYEWYRQLDEFPTVYIQALSGGTGPLGIAKGCSDLAEMGLINNTPRFLMVQSDCCNPMEISWNAAKQSGFKDGWENEYSVVSNPATAISTLATGNPMLYPLVARLAKNSGGEITSYPESSITDIARLVAYEVAVRIGPAAAIGVGGFFKALNSGYLRDGDRIVIAIGEGIRRSPEFMESLTYTSDTVSDLSDCYVVSRSDYGAMLRERIAALHNLPL